MSKTVTCPTCFYSDALLENEAAKRGTPEYNFSIYCCYCESGLAELDNKEELIKK